MEGKWQHSPELPPSVFGTSCLAGKQRICIPLWRGKVIRKQFWHVSLDLYIPFFNLFSNLFFFLKLPLSAILGVPCNVKMEVSIRHPRCKYGSILIFGLDIRYTRCDRAYSPLPLYVLQFTNRKWRTLPQWGKASIFCIVRSWRLNTRWKVARQRVIVIRFSSSKNQMVF